MNDTTVSTAVTATNVRAGRLAQRLNASAMITPTTPMPRTSVVTPLVGMTSGASLLLDATASGTSAALAMAAITVVATAPATVAAAPTSQTGLLARAERMAEVDEVEGTVDGVTVAVMTGASWRSVVVCRQVDGPRPHKS